jgi:uncharacterized delta-60 repeat protein
MTKPGAPGQHLSFPAAYQKEKIMKTIYQSIKVFASLLSLLLLLLPGVQVSAQEVGLQLKPGDLDFSFGIGGKVTETFMSPASLAIQKDNKIVVGGFGGPVTLVRYHAKGVLDMGFGNGGKAIKLLSSVKALALQSDGKILAAGFVKLGAEANFGLARYKPDGTPDASFGTGGLVTTDFFGLRDEANAIALQSDGRIVVGGQAAIDSITTDSALACYNPDGTPDFGFGVGGKLNLHLFFLPGFPDNFEAILGLAVQPDGHIVTVGSSNNRSAFARFQANGTPDAFFGMGGKIASQFEGANAANSIALQPDGRLLVGGSIVRTNGGSDFMMQRLLTNGTPDASFGDGGLVYTDFSGTTDSGQKMILLNDGRILQTGMANVGNINNFAYRDFGLVCYQSDGTLDPTFGNGGKVTTDFAKDFDSAVAIGIQQANSRIILVGQTIGEGNTLGLAGLVLATPNNQDLPQIQSATVKGKKLIVTGINFESPAELFINGEKQKKFANDEQSPTTTVIALKAGRFILPGATVALQMKNPVTGKSSDEFTFTRPLQ